MRRRRRGRRKRPTSNAERRTPNAEAAASDALRLQARFFYLARLKRNL
jgi:hypothetical protein